MRARVEGLDTFATFGELLRFLRLRAQLTQRELAIAVDYSEAQISRLEGNKRAPNADTLRALFVPALGLEEEPDIVAYLLKLAGQAHELAGEEIILETSQRHNLPRQLTTFIGRELDIDEICALLESDHTRLVTLTGAGGCGKTRLALEVSRRLIFHYPDSVWLADLVPLADPGDVPVAVATSLGLQPTGSLPAVDMLVHYLEKRQLLLVLDNCEHLIDACARLTDHLLRAAPSLVILATSREALGVEGEIHYRVPSLTTPDPLLDTSAEAIGQCEATRLFANRASLALPGFVINPSNASAVAEICRRLDGIPLAIELAAARLPVLSVEQIASRLDDRFHLLSAGSRAALPRHKTLRALIDWSYNLLSEKEKLLLMRLSMFAGGCTIETAEDACSADGIDKAEVLDLLDALVRKSLVVSSASKAGLEPRYHLLETIRQYALERLEASGGESSQRSRHLQAFMKVAERAERESKSPRYPYWVDRLEVELGNLRAALEWGLASGMPGDAQAGLRLIAAIVWQYFAFRFLEGTSYLEKYLALRARPGLIPPELLAKALQSKVIIMRLLGKARLLEMCQAGEEALSLYTLLEDEDGVVYTLISLAFVNAIFKEFPAVYHYLQAAEEVARQSGLLEKYRADLALNKGIAYDSVDPQLARRSLEESARVSEENGNPLGVSFGLGILGDLLSRLGEYERAEACLEKALRIAKKFNCFGHIVTWLALAGEHAYRAGRFNEMETYFREQCVLEEKIGNMWGVAEATYIIGVAVRRQGRIDEAAQIILDSMDYMLAHGYNQLLVFQFAGMAGIAGESGRLVESARLLGAVHALKQAASVIYLAELPRDTAMVRCALGDAAFEAAFDEGATLSLEETARLAKALFPILQPG